MHLCLGSCTLRQWGQFLFLTLTMLGTVSHWGVCVWGGGCWVGQWSLLLSPPNLKLFPLPPWAGCIIIRIPCLMLLKVTKLPTPPALVRTVGLVTRGLQTHCPLHLPLHRGFTQLVGVLWVGLYLVVAPLFPQAHSPLGLIPPLQVHPAWLRPHPQHLQQPPLVHLHPHLQPQHPLQQQQHQHQQ